MAEKSDLDDEAPLSRNRVDSMHVKTHTADENDNVNRVNLQAPESYHDVGEKESLKSQFVSGNNLLGE